MILNEPIGYRVSSHLRARAGAKFLRDPLAGELFVRRQFFNGSFGLATVLTMLGFSTFEDKAKVN